MNTLSKALSLSILAIACVLLTNVQADPFVMPPENYAPVWSTPFPYQRNINMDFNVNPVAAPGNGIPGAVYEGYLDPSLKTSDYVMLTGDTQWYESLPGFTQTGFLGIDNRHGTSSLSGDVIFHIDNTSNADNEKHLWEELVWMGTTGIGEEVIDSSGKSFSIIYWHNDMDTSVYVSDWEWVRSPNPQWEQVTFNFYVSPGNYLLFDNYHNATECVPEPATLTLLGIGVISLLAYAWRQRK
jgi:hypothetical protein